MNEKMSTRRTHQSIDRIASTNGQPLLPLSDRRSRCQGDPFIHPSTLSQSTNIYRYTTRTCTPHDELLEQPHEWPWTRLHRDDGHHDNLFYPQHHQTTRHSSRSIFPQNSNYDVQYFSITNIQSDISTRALQAALFPRTYLRFQPWPF